MNFKLFFFIFSCILISYNLSATVKKLTCFMFSYCINYSRHLTLKQQKNLHRELFIQMKGRSKDKPLSFQPFSECYMFLYFCGKNYFLFSIRSIMRNYISFCEKKKLLLSHSQSVSTICVILCVTILHGCFYCVFLNEVLLLLYRKTVSRECFGIHFEKSP